MTDTKPELMSIVLICAGKYHDINFARKELLALLGTYQNASVRVFEDYSNLEAIKACDLLVTYTCEVIPTAPEIKGLQDFIAGGGRWFALHGTNSILEFMDNGRVRCPDTAPEFMALLGSQFMTHPPLCKFTVEVSELDHPLTKGIDDFETFDELYVIDARADIQVLLKTRWGGDVQGFEQKTWKEADHPVMYIRPYGTGAVLYLTLGHCRSHYDLRPLMDYYPAKDRCSWENPIFYELLRRGLQWGTGDKLVPYDADEV